MYQETIERDTSHIVSTLLSLGASPRVIPAQLYTPYNQDLIDDDSYEDFMELSGNESNSWCTPAEVARLKRTMHLTHRYNLYTAAHMKEPLARQRQVARLHNAEALLRIPYFLIGQTRAVNLLIDVLLRRLALPGNQPLVLVFAGPSGHGKTELARCLGNLLTLDLEVVDCTTVKYSTDLFGPREHYRGCERGSPPIISWLKTIKGCLSFSWMSLRKWTPRFIKRCFYRSIKVTVIDHVYR